MIRAIIAIIIAMFARLSGRADASEKRVEAVRQRAAVDETVAALKDGAAQAELRRDWTKHPGASVIALALILSACAPAAPVMVDTYCDRARAILIADADQITDATARQILAHNKTWASACRK